MHPPTRSKTGTLLSYLRQETQGAHCRVEEHPMLAPLTGSDLDSQSYLRVLNAFLRYYEGLEPALEVEARPLLSRQGGRYEYLQRTGLLKADLADLEADIIDVEDSPAQPRIQTAAQALGWLYVLEGATQGGRVIAPRVSEQLGLTESHGARYFNLFTRNHWQAFRELAASCERTYNHERVLEGALEAFNTLSFHLDAWTDHTDRNGNHDHL